MSEYLEKVSGDIFFVRNTDDGRIIALQDSSGRRFNPSITVGSLSERPDAAKFGVGLCQIGSTLYASDGASWAQIAAGTSTVPVTNNPDATPVNVTGTSGVQNIFVNATAGNYVVNLPTAVGNTAKITVKKTDATANTVSVTPLGAETIDGINAATVLANKNDKIILYSDSTGWQSA